MIVVEGYFDAIALHQAGTREHGGHLGHGAHAGPGAAAARVVPRVALTYDGDAAGQEAMMRSLGVLLAEGLDVVVADLPAGEDPDTLVRGGGLEALAGGARARRATRSSSSSATCCAARRRAAIRASARCRRWSDLGVEGRRPDPAAGAGGAREPGVRASRSA